MMWLHARCRISLVSAGSCFPGLNPKSMQGDYGSAVSSFYKVYDAAFRRRFLDIWTWEKRIW